MSYRMRKIFALLVAVEFVFIGAMAYISEYGNVYADVGSIADGEAVYKIKVKPASIKKPTKGKAKFTAKWKRLKKTYAQVRTYIRYNGIKYYSEWSKKKSVKTRR